MRSPNSTGTQSEAQRQAAEGRPGEIKSQHHSMPGCIRNIEVGLPVGTDCALERSGGRGVWEEDGHISGACLQILKQGIEDLLLSHWGGLQRICWLVILQSSQASGDQRATQQRAIQHITDTAEEASTWLWMIHPSIHFINLYPQQSEPDAGDYWRLSQHTLAVGRECSQDKLPVCCRAKDEPWIKKERCMMMGSDLWNVGGAWM